MIASIPAAALPELVEGLQHILNNQQGLPLALTMQAEYEMAEPYVRTGRLMGMDWLK